MLSFDTGEGRFNYRVGGLALRGGRLLLHRAPGDAYWTPPGGRVDYGETAAEALAREMHEETGAAVAVKQLCFIAENFFTWRDQPFHELLLLHAMEVDDAALTAERFRGAEGDTVLEFAWVDWRQGAVTILPAFLPLALDPLPQMPIHVIQRG